MEVDIDCLPQTAVDIVEVVGIDAALRLVEAWGGLRLYVPQALPADHSLVGILGPALAANMAAHFGGEPLNIPRCLHALRSMRNQRIRGARRAGATPAELARQHSLTERQVYNILADDDGGQGDRQGSLL